MCKNAAGSGAEQDRGLGQPSQVPFAMCLAGCYSLSVRRGERAAWASVTHYRIHRLDNGWLYISPRLTFPSLHNLVDHYSDNAPPAPSTLSCVWGDSYALKGGRGKRGQLVPPLPRCAQVGGVGGAPY